MSWLLLVILLILVIGVLPRWQYSNKWGYGPSGLVSVALVVVMVLVLTRTIHIG